MSQMEQGVHKMKQLSDLRPYDSTGGTKSTVTRLDLGRSSLEPEAPS